MNKAIGEKVKNLRLEKKLTLKELSELSNFSTGFLSQLERGLTSVAVDTLSTIADILGVNLNYFFPKVRDSEESILRHHQRQLYQVENERYLQYHLTNCHKGKEMLAKKIEILPGNTEESITPYGHTGEEFVYVLSGRLTLILEEEEYTLYPRDCAHYKSERNHNWANHTKDVVEILVVSTPNPFKNIDL